MIRPYAENSGALVGKSVKSGIAKIMPAIMDVFRCDICGQNGIPLDTFGQSKPTKEIFLTMRWKNRERIARKKN
ncbi:MAG: hypothetical protein WKF36_11260 [Candidatus Nitrosocosmicus sp.]